MYSTYLFYSFVLFIRKQFLKVILDLQILENSGYIPGGVQNVLVGYGNVYNIQHLLWGAELRLNKLPHNNLFPLFESISAGFFFPKKYHLITIVLIFEPQIIWAMICTFSSIFLYR